jgi:hypothetical protein
MVPDHTFLLEEGEVFLALPDDDFMHQVEIGKPKEFGRPKELIAMRVSLCGTLISKLSSFAYSSYVLPVSFLLLR